LEGPGETEEGTAAEPGAMGKEVTTAGEEEGFLTDLEVRLARMCFLGVTETQVSIGELEPTGADTADLLAKDIP